MSKKAILLIISLILVVVGVPLSVFADTKGPEPTLVCAKEGEPTSGYKSDDKDCPISIESMRKWSEWFGKPQPVKIAGLFTAAGGVLLASGVGVTALVQKVRRKKA